MRPSGPGDLLVGLDAAQREAVELTTGPLGILAGAGSGKTRVISRRAAYAIATEVVDPGAVLLVAFTEKAAREMAERISTLGFPGVMARTFHSMALAQLSWFWPSRHDGRPLPELLPSKGRIVGPLVRRLPGHYRFTPSKDVADAIEWAKVRRIEPRRWLKEGDEHAPIPPDLFVRLYTDYERAKQRAGLLDFEDLLIEAVRLFEDDAAAAATVRERKRWFSVDEYQDTNPLAERLLSLWTGESTDLCVVGDPDQTIYTFTGATPDFLLGFEARHPGARVIRLLSNYRSTPSILALANRLTTGGPRGDLVPTRPDGPPPIIRRHADADSELEAITRDVAALIAGGLRPSEIAILVRVNAQIPPLEEAFTRAGLPYRANVRFFARRDVRAARRIVDRIDPALTGDAFVERLAERFAGELGLGDEDGGPEARERDASLELLLELARDLVHDDPSAGSRQLGRELGRRAAAEGADPEEGVELLTYHRAKGLEWRAVFLPAIEEGLLPIRQAQDDAGIAEERRLLYVGITRAMERLVISWAQHRELAASRGARRSPSRFLEELAPTRVTRGRSRPARAVRSAGSAGAGPGRPDELPDSPPDQALSGALPDSPPDQALLEELRAWRRRRAAADGVPAYVVAPDRTLAAIVEARPGSLHSLLAVHGMGPARLERYGEEIMAVIEVGASPEEGRPRSQALAGSPASGRR